MKPIVRLLASLSVFFGAIGAAQAAEVRAWLDRNSMQIGETVTLNVEVAGDAQAAQPDFNGLRGDFNLLGTQSSSSFNMINGQTTSKLLWAVALEPRHAGTLTIPALQIAGANTQPLTITVAAAATSSNAKGGDDVFVEVNAVPQQLYVQQQLRLTVKLYYAINLTEGALDDPQGEGLIVHKLGQDANYMAEVSGRRYHVLERHYAIAAEKSGKLAIAPITFRGRAIDPNNFNSFFNRGRGVNAQAQAVELDVRARPAASGADTWLPAQQVTLSAEGIDATTAARVGEPITLTLRERAQGQGFEQLPELKLPRIDGADVYPDKETPRNRDDGVWLYGERERKFAVVPNRPGTLKLPALSLSWWDTEHDRAATADLPALAVDVAPAPAIAPSQIATAPTPQPVAGTAPTPVAVATESAASDVQLGIWRGVAIVALTLWLATLGWFFVQRKRVVAAPPAAVDESAARMPMKFDAACASGNLSAVAQSLLATMRSQRPDIRHLGDVQRVLADDQANLIGELTRAQYAPAGAEVDTRALIGRLQAAFRRGFVFAKRPAGIASASALPPLYPFGT